MSDAWAVLLAVAVSVGAWLGLAVPVWFGALVVLVALVVRRPVLLCVGGALLAGGLSAAAWAGTAPPRSAPFTGVVTLVRDPETVAGAVRVQVRALGHRYEAWARGAPGATLERAEAGERLELVGPAGPGAGRPAPPPGRGAHAGSAAGRAGRGLRRRECRQCRGESHPAHARRRRVAAVAGRTGLVHGFRARRRSGRAARPGGRLPGLGPESFDCRVRRKSLVRDGVGRSARCGASASAPATSSRSPSWRGSRCSRGSSRPSCGRRRWRPWPRRLSSSLDRPAPFASWRWRWRR